MRPRFTQRRGRQCEGSDRDGDMFLQTEGYQSHQKLGGQDRVSAIASGGTHVLCVANKQSSVCSELTAVVLNYLNI